MNTLSVKVINKVKEADDIVSFELASADGCALPPFSAGSHIDVRIGNSLIRQYSLCNAPTERHRYLIAVLRDPHSRGGSKAMHDTVCVGDVLQISAPKNHFPLVHGKRSLLFAGGIGVTPILCMAERLAQIRADFTMHYCTRSIERTAFLSRIGASSFADRIQHHFDAGPAEQKLDLPAVLATPDPGTHLYICGPGGFIEHVVDTAKHQGWPGHQIHLEYFGVTAPATAADAEFAVKIASTGKLYTIAANKTVTEVLRAHGMDIPVSCEQGVCGTCITRVLDGMPDHRDVYFTEEEHARNDQFTPCCSRAKSQTLMLDL
jgi:vanillate O-demethylase ferredoxin subunit